jgi:hypothetical protein
VVILAVTACGCASHETARVEAVQTLAQGEKAPHASAVVGLTSSVWRDRWTAANLFERAADGRGAPLDLFNMAAGYEATGRIEEARALYQRVREEGRFTYAYSVPNNYDRGRQLRRFNLADEAERRLTGRSQGRSAMAVTPATARAFSVVAGEPTTGGPTTRISDETALSLDRLSSP